MAPTSRTLHSFVTATMHSSSLALLMVLLFPASARACAVPHGGCLPSQCAKYSTVTPSKITSYKNYTNPATWLQGSLPLIGYYVGLYNRAVNHGSYDTAGVPGTPALNYERFDLETSTIDPKTGKPYATPSTETTMVDCCNKCAKTDNCNLFQFYYGALPPLANGKACYLLSGGSSDYVDFPEHGVPFSGTHSQQNPGGSQYSVPLSFIGGRCNGSPGVVADPHFTGARGVRFDFNGDLGRSFCLTTDRRVHVNALLKGYRDNRTEGATVAGDGKALRTWIRELAVLWKDANGGAHTLHLVARSGKRQERGAGFLADVALDNFGQAVPSHAGTGIAKGGMTFTFLGTHKNSRSRQEEDRFRLTVNGVLDLSIVMRTAATKMQTEDEAQVHFNLLFNSLEATEKVHGVLGQTYRSSAGQIAKAVKYHHLSRLLGGSIQADGESGRGFLEGSVKDYQTSSITAPDCRFSAFV